MKNLKERAIKASAKYLELRGYDVLDSNYPVLGDEEIDIVAQTEHGLIVFVDVRASASSENGLPEQSCSGHVRKHREMAAIEWMQKHPKATCDVPVRFDNISLVVIGEDRALIRHHINCLGDDGYLPAVEEPKPACATA